MQVFEDEGDDDRLLLIIDTLKYDRVPVPFNSVLFFPWC